MRRATLALPLAALLVAGGCKEAPAPVAAKEPAACDAVPPMALAGRVTDAADILTGEEEARLTERLARYETRTQHQMVVATFRGLTEPSCRLVDDEQMVVFEEYRRLAQGAVHTGREHVRTARTSAS